MTPIHPKDKPKVIALGTVTVVMVGFFLMTVIGATKKQADGGHLRIAGSPPPDATPPAAVPVPGAPGAPAPLPPVSGIDPNKVAVETTLVNPFRHVLPDPAEIQRMLSAANRPKEIKRPPPMPPLTGSLPAAGGPVASLSVVVPPAPMIRLDGVVTDRDRYAMVTFNDRTDMYHVGTRIAGMFTVIGVTESGASFRGPKGVFRLDVGDERNSAEPVGKNAPAAKGAPSTKGVPSAMEDSPADEPKVAKQAAPRHAAPPALKAPHYEVRPQDVAEYATLPLPNMEGPAAGRGH